MNKIDAQLLKDCVRLYFPDGTLKVVGYEDFIRTLSVNQLVDEKRRIGPYPKGFFDIVISKKGQLRVIVIVQEGSYIFRLDERNTEKSFNNFIPFPPLWFEIEYNKVGTVTEMVVFALEKNDPKETDWLFQYPFGNVSRDGKVCLGGNLIKGISCARDVEKAIAVFFSSKSNSDYYGMNNASILSLRELLLSLVEKTTFPRELLIKSSFTIKERMDFLINKI